MNLDFELQEAHNYDFQSSEFLFYDNILIFDKKKTYH